MSAEITGQSTIEPKLQSVNFYHKMFTISTGPLPNQAKIKPVNT